MPNYNDFLKEFEEEEKQQKLKNIKKYSKDELKKFDEELKKTDEKIVVGSNSLQIDQLEELNTNKVKVGSDSDFYDDSDPIPMGSD